LVRVLRILRVKTRYEGGVGCVCGLGRGWLCRSVRSVREAEV
jgi:hypothetical protein